MRTGELNDRVTIEQPSVTSDQARTKTWATLATVWAAIRASSGGEQIESAAVISSVSYEVEIRYRADVTPSMRVSWTPYLAAAAKTLQILGVRMTGRDRLILDCAETV